MAHKIQIPTEIRQAMEAEQAELRAYEEIRLHSVDGSIYTEFPEPHEEWLDFMEKMETKEMREGEEY